MEIEQVTNDQWVIPSFSPFMLSQNPEHLFCDDLWYRDSVECISNRFDCADYYLSAMLNGEIVIQSNSTPLVPLLRLNSKVQDNGRFSSLQQKYLDVLQSIQNNLVEVLGMEDESPFDINWDDIVSDAWQYGDDACFVRSIVYYARQVARLGYVDKMVRYLAKFPKITNLYGGHELKLSNFDLSSMNGIDLTKYFRDFGTGDNGVPLVSMTKKKDDWYLRFYQLGPESDNYIFMQDAYGCAAEFLAYAFSADVELVSWLDDR